MNSLNFYYIIMASYLISYLIYNSLRSIDIQSLFSNSDSNPFLSIIAIIISITTVVISWYLHKHRINYEISNEHFNQIKNQVITPLLTLLKTNYNDLPSIEEIKNKSNIYGVLKFDYSTNYITDSGNYNIGENINLDCDLTIDCLDSHYIKLITIWNDTIILNEEKVVNLEKLRKYIQSKLQYQLEPIFFDKEKNKQEFQLNKYIDHFIKLLETNSYKESLIEIYNPGYDWRQLNFNSIGPIFTGTLQLCQTLKTSLVAINHEILNNNVTVEYLQSNKKINSQVRLFYNTLKKIFYATKLKFVKQYWFQKKCEFVKEDI